MKAILFATALAITAAVSFGADEPIEFATGFKNYDVVTQGRRFHIEGQIAKGTNPEFQWFYLSNGSRTTNAIPGATNIWYSVEFADATDSGEYLLRARNSVSEVSHSFHVSAYWAPNYPGGFGGWQGVKGESFRLPPMDQVGEVTPTQWFKDGQPIAQPPMSGILDEQTEGTYWFVATNQPGDVFVSPRATLRIAPVANTERDFRRVVDDSFVATLPGQPFVVSERMHEDGSVTFRTGKSIYRWKRGGIDKILDLAGAPEVFGGNDWTLRYSIVSEDQSFADIEAHGDNRIAFLRKDAGGFKTLGVNGMTLNTDPPLVAERIASLQNAGAKSAFWAIGPAVPWPNNPCFALKVYDGVQTVEWFNSNEAWPESLSTYAPSIDHDPFNNRSLGFDGTTAAFVAHDNVSHRSALIAVTAAGEPFVIARVGDMIPGTTNRFRSFSNVRVTVRDGKILFLAAIIENFLNRILVEYDPTLPEKFRLIAMEGQSVGNLSIAAIYPLFDYLADGSVVFNANAGSFHSENQLRWSPPELPLETIFRWSNGTLSIEVTSRERLGGAQMINTFLTDAGGTNYVFNSNGTLWTTAPGAERPADARVTTRIVPEGLEASWTGQGILQSSADFVRWKTHLYSAGVVTNQLSTNAQFFRVYYP